MISIKVTISWNSKTQAGEMKALLHMQVYEFTTVSWHIMLINKISTHPLATPSEIYFDYVNE